MEIKQILKLLDDYNYKKDYENSYNYVFYKKFGFDGQCKISIDISLFSNTIFFRFDVVEVGQIHNIAMGRKMFFEQMQEIQLVNLLDGINKLIFEYERIFK